MNGINELYVCVLSRVLASAAGMKPAAVSARLAIGHRLRRRDLVGRRGWRSAAVNAPAARVPPARLTRLQRTLVGSLAVHSRHEHVATDIALPTLNCDYTHNFIILQLSVGISYRIIAPGFDYSARQTVGNGIAWRERPKMEETSPLQESGIDSRMREDAGGQANLGCNVVGGSGKWWRGSGSVRGFGNSERGVWF